MPGFLAQAPQSSLSVPEENFKNQYFGDGPPFSTTSATFLDNKMDRICLPNVVHGICLDLCGVHVPRSCSRPVGHLQLQRNRWNWQKYLIQHTDFNPQLLVSVMRMAMLLPVASGIAQLKWDWYRNRHSLADIEVYDDAMVGVAGSLKLLAKRRFWQLLLSSPHPFSIPLFVCYWEHHSNVQFTGISRRSELCSPFSLLPSKL